LALIDTLTASFAWKPDDNDLIDLRAKLWLNNSREETLRHYVRNSTVIINAEMMSYGFSIDNNSQFNSKLGSLTLNYGVEVFRDDAATRATSDEIKQNPALASNFTTFSPTGQRDLASFFANAEYKMKEWVVLSAGLRYDWYSLKGTPAYYGFEPANNYLAGCFISRYDYYSLYDPGFLSGLPPAAIRRLQRQCGEVYEGQFYQYRLHIIPGKSTPERSPAYKVNIDRSGGALLPSASIEFKPFDWLHPYVSYSRSYRPPATAEAFFTGGMTGFVRPNTSFSANESLRPERGETWEVGVNINRNALFSNRDSLRLKASAFDRTIKDLIVIGRLFPSATLKNYEGYVNTIDDMKMRGVEIEGNYDAGKFWIGGSATWMEIDWPRKTQRYWHGRTLASNTVVLFANGDVPPKFNAVIDTGIKFLEERLVLGGRVTYAMPTLARTPAFRGGYEMTEPYTKLDLYGSYKINDRATLRVNIDNVNDVNHVAPGSRYPASGRTIFASLQTRW